MRTFVLDPLTGDLALTGGKLTLVEGASAVAQRIRGRLGLWAGEYFVDTTVGVPWLLILGVKNAETFAAATFRRAIETCPGVAALESFAFTMGVDRTAAVAFRARTTDGEIVDEGGFRLGVS